MKSFVLDSYAVLAFYANEPGADFVRNLFTRSSSSEIKLLMSIVNLGEVWYTFDRRTSTNDADQVITEIQGMKVEITTPDWEQTRQAAVYKAKFRIAYADCFAAALAKLHNAELVTGDPEFQKLQDKISILWLYSVTA
jgi:predicted nucleic acid-binding protein